MKRIFCIFTIFMICISSFFMGYTDFVYADVDEWYQVTTNEQAAEAFRYYCKSRDLTIEGSALDAVTTFTSGTYKSLCQTVGLDMDAIQANLKYSVDQSGKINKFLFNASGVNAMNRLFSQFLQDNDLEVGDSVSEDDPIIPYSGYIFRDLDGNDCLVYIVTAMDTQGYVVDDPGTNNIVKYGTPLKYTPEDIEAMAISNGYNNFTIEYNLITGRSFFPTIYSRSTTLGGNTYYIQSQTSQTSQTSSYNYGWYLSAPDYIYNFGGKHKTLRGYNTIFYYSGSFYYGHIAYEYADNQVGFYFTNSNRFVPSSDQSKDVSIYIYCPDNKTINNNNYSENNYTTINNEGDVNNYYGDDEPTPDEPTTPDPTEPPITYPNNPLNPIDPDDPDSPFDFNMPDIDLPGLNIVGLKDKFPFSIPWDLAAFYAFMDAPPEAPRFTGTVDLKIYEWNYDIDFSPFDPAAELCRKLQFGLFVVGLIVATRSLIRG